MEYYALGLYQKFSCLAGDCPATCCAGWSIFVSSEDYERFLKLSPEWLRQDILSNIQKKEDGYYFKNQKDGRCTMLEEDGLCRIQKNADEETLCNTCRKYPRLFHMVQGTLYLSMAASCPVVSEYLVKDTVAWFYSDGNGRTEPVGLQELFKWQEESDARLPKWESFQQRKETVVSNRILLSGFEALANEVLSIILSYQEGNELLKEFQIFEQEIPEETLLERMDEFITDHQKIWERIRNNYMKYRFVNGMTEVVSKNYDQSMLQIKAELVLVRLLAFCRYTIVSSLSVSDWCEAIQMGYRFCVHGKKVSAAFRHMADTLFSREDIWNGLLQ